MDDNLHIDLLINSKSKSKTIIKEIYQILKDYKVTVDISKDTFNDTLNSFLINYVKLLTFIDRDKDDIKNRNTIDNLIEDIISKSENNIALVPELNSKKIEIKTKCENTKDSKTNFNIIMKH